MFKTGYSFRFAVGKPEDVVARIKSLGATYAPILAISGMIASMLPVIFCTILCGLMDIATGQRIVIGALLALDSWLRIG